MMEGVMESYSVLAKAAAAAVVCWVVAVVLYVVTTILKRRKLPPGPFPWPIIGNIPSIGPYPHQSYVELAKQYGNIFTIYIGSARVVVVTNGALAKEVLQVQDAKFAHRPVHDLMYTCAKHLDPDGQSSFSLGMWNPKTREMRQMCDRHFMLPRRVEATKESRREEVWRTVGKIEQASTGENIDVRHLGEELAFRITCRSSFNKAFVAGGTLSPEVFWGLGRDYSKLLVEQNPSDVIPLLKPLGDVFGVNKKWQKIAGPYLEGSSKIQSYYRDNTSDDQDELDLDYLELLMRKCREGAISEYAVDRDNIGVMVAGSDTNAVTLEWALLELVRHPDMMQKLRAEIDAKFGDDSPVEEESLLQLPYLQAVVKETLRLHHPAPLSLPHYNTEETVIAGYTIPAGTTLVTDLYAIQRNPEDWGEDALEFNPERFQERDVNVMGSADLSYMPFSAGRRVCPGRQISVRGTSLAVAALVHAFKWEAVPGYELSVEEAAGGLNCRAIQPLILRAVSRPQVSLYHS